MVYILHLETPLCHARHYVGFSRDGRTLKERIAHHRDGTARCRFTEVLHERGIGFVLACVFKQGDRTFERKLKNTNHTARYCPICNPHARKYHPKEKTCLNSCSTS